jgi:hypothetical protein
MYQVNYKGLQRRESYDEIVALLETDQTKIKYPNRVALQILNSPYMRQLDAETLMDMQNQQDRVSKGKLKELVLQEVGKQTGTPYVQVRAQSDPARHEAVVQQVREVGDYMDALSERASEFRETVGETLDADTQTEHIRRLDMVNLTAKHLSDQAQRYNPVAHEMTMDREIQAMADTASKKTQTGMMREEEELRRMADENRQMELMLKEKGTHQQKMQEIYNKLEERLRHAERLSLARPEHKAAITSIGSSIQAVAGGGKMSPEEAQEMLRRLRLLYEKGGGYGGSSSSSGMFGSLASMFNIFTPQATPRYPSARKRPAPEPEEPQMQRAQSEPGSRASAKSFSIGSAVAIPVKNEPVKAESVKSEPKSRTATHSGNISQRYPLFAEGVKKQSGSVKSASVKSAKRSSAAGSAAQRMGMMALPVGNEPYEGPSIGGSTTSSARRRREGIKTPTALRSSSRASSSKISSLNDFQIGEAIAVPMTGVKTPSVVSVHSSRKSGKGM